MNPFQQKQQATRREFLNSSASGLGGIALGSMLAGDGLFSEANAKDPKKFRELTSHSAPKAKSCIFIFTAGAPSQLDLFDHKPKLNELDGTAMPEELTKKARFAFLQPDTAKLMGSPRTWKRHGECGMELSDLLPNLGNCADDLLLVRSMHSEEFNHHPGQLLMQCGVSRFGMPTMGSWINYGLGSASENLPGYVVLTAGRGSSGGSTLWQSGFLPSKYAGVPFRNQGEPVLNLSNPAGLPPELQRAGLDALKDLNELRFQEVHDPEIASRISNFELANRMQTAAPELVDLKSESQETLDLYGVGRPEPDGSGFRGTVANQPTYEMFSRNCLLARRMVERGVRFINVIHASWDQHSDLDKQLAYNAGVVDQPIAALITDLKRRGLLDETLVVWGSEFGRTPLGENRRGRSGVTGRDHHPFAYSVMMAGGGMKGGLTYGETDEIGWSIVDKPVHANDLAATILHQFGLDHVKLTYRFQGRDFRLTDVGGKVITDWLA